MTKRATARPSPLPEADQSQVDRHRPDENESEAGSVELPDLPSSRVSSPVGPPTTGFLGSTSFLDPFSDGQHDVRVTQENRNTDICGCYVSEKAPKKDAPLVQEGADVLKVLISIPMYGEGLEAWYKLRTWETTLPYVRNCIQKIKFKTSSGASEPLLDLSHTITLKTSQCSPFKWDKPLADAAESAFGEDLTWEVVGLMLVVAGRSALITSACSHLGEANHSLPYTWMETARLLLRAGTQCVRFCSEYGQLNDLGFHLILFDLILHSHIYGDADYLCWRKMGDVAAAIFALGLHKECDSKANLPFFYLELRRRAFWEAYLIDKELATFLGRPPLINGRYCTIGVPLDFQEDALSLYGDKLQTAFSKLDANGWSREDSVSRWTWLRSSAISLRYREDILELSLGPGKHTVESSVRSIQERQNEAFRTELPRHLLTAPTMWIGEKSPTHNLFLVLSYLNFEYNDFILQRALAKSGQATSSYLLHISHTVLTALLILTGNRHQLGPYNIVLPWIIAMYGLPTAAVLALELLRHSSTAFSDKSTDFPRLRIVKDLSVFVSDIDYILRPSHGNYAICTQARKTLQTILDTVLANALGLQNQASNDAPATTQMADDVDVSGFDDLDWLNNDFDLEFWTNLEEHPFLT